MGRYKFEIGDTVIISNELSRYFGRTAKVLKRRSFADDTKSVYAVKIPELDTLLNYYSNSLTHAIETVSENNEYRSIW